LGFGQGIVQERYLKFLVWISKKKKSDYFQTDKPFAHELIAYE
jgi:hypothetical protein